MQGNRIGLTFRGFIAYLLSLFAVLLGSTFILCILLSVLRVLECRYIQVIGSGKFDSIVINMHFLGVRLGNSDWRFWAVLLIYAVSISIVWFFIFSRLMRFPTFFGHTDISPRNTT